MDPTGEAIQIYPGSTLLSVFMHILQSKLQYAPSKMYTYSTPSVFTLQFQYFHCRKRRTSKRALMRRRLHYTRSIEKRPHNAVT